MKKSRFGSMALCVGDSVSFPGQPDIPEGDFSPAPPAPQEYFSAPGIVHQPRRITGPAKHLSAYGTADVFSQAYHPH